MADAFARCLRTWFALGCALACAAAPAQMAVNFPKLDTSSVAPTPRPLSTSSALKQKGDWAAIQKETCQLADCRVGSFEGVSTRRWFRSHPVKIHYRYYVHKQESSGGIVISSGRTEGLALYQELIQDLVNNGYSVYILDHRGQGFSSRLLAPDDDPTKGYIDEFDNYLEDLRSFTRKVAEARRGNDKPLFILAHSMGGAIASGYLERFPGEANVKAAALVTPMHQPAFSKQDGSVLGEMEDGFCENWFGSFTLFVPWLSKSYALMNQPFDKIHEEYKAMRHSSLKRLTDENGITHDPDRLDRNWQAREARCDSAADCGHGDARIGGATHRWARQACSASRDIRADAAKITVPVLLLHGEEDRVVMGEAQQTFCNTLNQAGPAGKAGYCAGYTVPKANHAVFIETDEIRGLAISKVLAFFDCVRAGAGRCK